MRRTTRLTACLLAFILLTACTIDRGADGDKKDKGPKASTEKADLHTYYKLSDALYLTVIDGVVNEDRSIKSDGQVYIPYSVAKSLDARFYYNKTEEQMIITTPTDVLVYKPNSTEHTVNGTYVTDTVPMFRAFDTRLYVSTEVFAAYSDVSTVVLTKPQRVVLFRNGVAFSSMTATKDTAIRIGTSFEQDIVTELKKGDRVVSTGENKNGFISVSTSDGQVGYVASADMTGPGEWVLQPSTKNYPRIGLPSGSVHLMWHQMWTKLGANDLTVALSDTQGINVICPTWFDFKDTSGNITSLADASYVEEAHRHGILVWALCSDFAADVKGLDILSHTESRNALEDNLIAETVRVGADGINLDYEFITKDSAPHYLQFIRELYIKCRKNGLSLSTDNFVPNAGKAHYQLADQGYILDYVIFMAYDEHYKGSKAGSVASFPWVESAMKSAVKLVPADRIVLGLPLFNRVWMTNKEGITTQENGGMTKITDAAYKNAKPVWDDECKQFYAEYKQNDILYQYWIEDTESLKYKLDLIPAYHLAGFAGWKLGLEAPNVWGLLNQY